MSAPDREAVAEALTNWNPESAIERFPDLIPIFDAARAWLEEHADAKAEQGNAITIQRDDNGQWPEWRGPFSIHDNTGQEIPLRFILDVLSVEGDRMPDGREWMDTGERESDLRG